MPHLHTGPGEHDHTVSAYVVRVDGPEPRAVLHRHKKLDGFLQFGGHVELDENPWQAIRHELLEESGYDFDELELLQPPDRVRSLGGGVLHPVPVCYTTHEIGGGHFHSDAGWAFVAHGAPTRAVAEGESEELVLLGRDELLDPQGRAHASVRDVFLFVFDVCLPRWERLPAGAR